MNKPDLNIMKTYFKTIASALVVFTLVITPVAKTIAFGGLDFVFNDETLVQTDASSVTNTSVSNTSIGSSSSVNTFCNITASRSLVDYGGSFTINWDTGGFNNITINGEAVSGNSGSKVIDKFYTKTTFELRATDGKGSTCVQRVIVDCKPPVQTYCELEVTKSVDRASAVVGDNLTYTINVKNVGDADCTGDGVFIADPVDSNLTYISHTISSNLIAGYGYYPVFREADKTLYFNGGTLTPGEVGTINWVGKVNNPTTCGDFEVKNQAKATAKELNNFNNWVYSQIVKTNIDNNCADKFATVVAQKIVCTNEAELPNFGAGGPNITSSTAANWVASHSSCSLVPDWRFEWTTDETVEPANDFIGVAGSPWKVFGPTNTQGRATETINLSQLTGTSIWLREVMKNGYVTFADGFDKGGKSSSEFYCNDDVLQYDNREYIGNMTEGSTYYCVAWNLPKEEVKAPTCDLFTATPATITVGSKTTLNWNSTNATQAFINNGVGNVAVDGSTEVSPLVSTTYKLTLTGAGNQTIDCQVPVTVSADPVPVCELFTASPSSLPHGGGNVVLNWKVSQATSVNISPTVGAVNLVGSTNVAVTQSTNFNLTARDANNDEVSCSVPVTVAGSNPPLTCSDNVNFSVSDSSIDRGDDVTLNWSTTDVDSVSISVINETSLSGSRTVSPTSDTTYTLTAKRGTETVNCPVSVNVSSGGGGGGSSSPRCELDISDEKIKAGQEIKLTWDTSRATEITLKDDKGKVIFTTDNYSSSDKKDYYDGSVTLKPTRDTKYTLTAERGSKDRDCTVSVDVSDSIVVLQSRDQQPLVAGISLSQVPYTGFEAGPFLTSLFYILLITWSLYIAYLLIIRRKLVSPGDAFAMDAEEFKAQNSNLMKQAEMVRPDLFVRSVSAPRATWEAVPDNLPTASAVIGYQDYEDGYEDVNPHQVSDIVVTDLENRAHAQNALLSSDAVRYFIGTTSGEIERNQALDEVIAEAKKNYPLEDGWIIINESRMQNLCLACNESRKESVTEVFTPATIPEGSGSLAEAIVTGNIVAAYDMIGNRPMFSLADAAADLDALYRFRRDNSVQVSELLKTETANLSDERIKNMISALTGALDGTYTDEASAVKMAILKAVKEAA
jgi:uncharacterized repeat protein (TIGR01451 family)